METQKNLDQYVPKVHYELIPIKNLVSNDIIAQHPLWKQAGIYADKGRSSKEFDRLMLDCREEKVDLILTQSISRFSRHFDDAIKRVRELKDFGVGVYFLNTGFYTLGNMSDFVLRVLTTIVLEESRKNSMSVIGPIQV